MVAARAHTNRRCRGSGNRTCSPAPSRDRAARSAVAASRGAPISMDDRSELPSNVSLGEGCLFEHTRATFAHFRSTRDPGLRLGEGVQVFQGTTFSVEANGIVEIGEGSVLAGAVFMCAEAITLGRGVVASYNVTIADCDFHPLDPGLRRRDAIAVAPEGDRGQRP